MSIPKDQLINAIVIGLSAIFLAKLFGPLIFSLFNDVTEKKKKSGGSNLEAMIAHKEAMLRRGENKAQSGINNAALEAGIKNKRSGKGLVELSYLDKLDQDRAVGNEEILEDTQKVVTLLESLQWGEGPALAEVRMKFNKKFGSAPEQRIFLSYLRNLLKRELPLARETKNLPLYKELLDLLILKTFLQSFCMADDYSISLSKSFANKIRVSQSAVQKAVATLFAKREGKNEKMIYASILSASDPFEMWDLPSRENLVNKCLITEDKKYFTSLKEIIEELSKEAHLFHTLSPLPELSGKQDVSGALNIFGLSEEATTEEIKKTYKKLSMLKHPDRLASKGIPKSFEDVAHENFTRIQSAYEILKNKES